LIYKYLMTLPNLDGVNDLCWKGSKYKRPALLYVRFLIAFLPNIPEKILWLDNDTIICKDLFSLFNIDISEFVWAGAEDPTYHCTRKEYEEKLGKMYLHNGMMLVNMLQADPIFKQIIADYFTTDYRVFGDMNIINEYKRKKLAKSFLSFNPINEIIIFHVCYSCCYHSFLVYMWHKFTSFFSKKYFKGQHFLSSKYGKPHKQIIKTNDLIFYKKNKQLNPLLKSVNEYLTKSNNEIK
jgi:lipopolysaccharide biosynthesis glycosyltransferase